MAKKESTFTCNCVLYHCGLTTNTQVNYLSISTTSGNPPRCEQSSASPSAWKITHLINKSIVLPLYRIPPFLMHCPTTAACLNASWPPAHRTISSTHPPIKSNQCQSKRDWRPHQLRSSVTVSHLVPPTHAALTLHTHTHRFKYLWMQTLFSC